MPGVVGWGLRGWWVVGEVGTVHSGLTSKPSPFASGSAAKPLSGIGLENQSLHSQPTAIPPPHTLTDTHSPPPPSPTVAFLQKDHFPLYNLNPFILLWKILQILLIVERIVSKSRLIWVDAHK